MCGSRFQSVILILFFFIIVYFISFIYLFIYFHSIPQSPLALRFWSLPFPLPIVFVFFQVHLSQLVSSSFSCSTVFFSSQARTLYLSPFSFSFNFYSVICWDGKVHYSAGSLFCWLSLRLIIIIIIIIYSLEFFTSALADGLSLEIEWQQVSSSLQDSSQYSGRFQ